MRDRLVGAMNEEKVRKLSKQLSRVLVDNKNSLKALLGVWKELFELLPSGLQLQEFSPSESTKSEDIKIPCLDTKLFKYKPHPSMFSRNWSDTTPLPFMGINADEIHLEVGQPHDPSVTFAHNTRVKTLRITFREADGCDFARLFRQVTACCPSLEHFKFLHERDIYHTFDTDGDNPLPVATDFTCGLLKSDLPCTEEQTIGKGYFCFVKQAIFGRKVLDVHCDVQHDDACNSYDNGSKNAE